MSDRPIQPVLTGLSKFKLPVLRFRANDGSIGIVQSLVTHPDNGAVFQAEFVFENEDGTTRAETWRGKHMLGEFFIGDYQRP